MLIIKKTITRQLAKKKSAKKQKDYWKASKNSSDLQIFKKQIVN